MSDEKKNKELIHSELKLEELEAVRGGTTEAGMTVQQASIEMLINSYKILNYSKENARKMAALRYKGPENLEYIDSALRKYYD